MSDANKKNLIYLGSIAMVTVVLWQLPFGNLVLYPFTILGTWFHEMAHGIMALLLGGNFHQLEIYSDGSGLAMHSGDLFFGGIGRAFVAAAGPVGPTISGSIMLLSSKDQRSTKTALFILSFLLMLTPFIWIRSLFGFLIILGIGLIVMFISLKGSNGVKRLTLQFLAIQSFVSSYMSIGYLFSSGGVVNGTLFMSDTAQIAANLFLPYWFWAILIICFSVSLIFLSFKKVFK